LAGLSGELSQTGDTTAKTKIGSVLTNAQRTAAGGNRGNTGTLGDAFQAAMGKRAVAKEGYTYDERTQRYHEFDAKTGKVGKMAKATDAKMGRLGGAASILGNFIGNKTEEFVEGHRSERVQGFLDNFRSTESGTRGEQIANLQGQQTQLERSPMASTPLSQPQAQPIPQKTGPKMVIGSAGTAAAGRGAGQRLQAQTLNITGQVIQLKAAKVEMAGGESQSKLYEDSGGRSGEKKKEEAQATATAAAAESGGGLGLGDALDVGRAGLSKAGGMLKGAGSAILSGGKTVLGKGAGLVKGLSPAIKGGGAAAILGLGASYAGDKLKDAGYEKTGSALDVAGQAASWGGTGAMIGSVIPGVGTAIGAGVGAVAGAGYGLYKNWGGLFGEKKPEEGAAAKPTSPLAGKPVDTAKAQAAAKEQYQAAKTEEAKAAEKLQAFEKENQFDYREKPTATQEFLDMPGTGKFKDPKKQAEYNKLQDAKYKAEEAKQKAGQDYTKAEGVTKTTKFGGDGKPGADITSAGAKIQALKKRGYTDEQLGRDDSLTKNYVGIGGAKYSSRALGMYEEVVAKELEGSPQGTGVGAKAGATSGRDEKVGPLSASIQTQRDSDKSKPVVITNNNTAPSTGGQTQTFARRGAVRPDESAMERYANRNAHFF